MMIALRQSGSGFSYVLDHTPSQERMTSRGWQLCPVLFFSLMYSSVFISLSSARTEANMQAFRLGKPSEGISHRPAGVGIFAHPIFGDTSEHILDFHYPMAIKFLRSSVDKWILRCKRKRNKFFYRIITLLNVYLLTLITIHRSISYI
jgi:hypothetical protein